MEDDDIKRIEEERRKKINFEMRNRHRRGYEMNSEIRNDYEGYNSFNNQSHFNQGFNNNLNTNQSFNNNLNTNQGPFNSASYNQQLNPQGFNNNLNINQGPFNSASYNQQLNPQGFNNNLNINQGPFNLASYNQQLNPQSLNTNQSFNVNNTNQSLPININNTLHSIPTNYTEPPSYSLKLSNFYFSNFVFKPNFHQIENAIRQEAQHAISDQILKLKIEINKRLNQVNNDPDKVEMIGNMLKVYSNNYIFIDIFTCKFIEQSTVQISRNLNLYRPFGHLFKKVFTDSLLDFYKASVIKKTGDGPALKGIYGGFFGVLIEMDFVEELWAFGAGLLNGEYNENTFVVLEVYLIVGGDYLKAKSIRQYGRLQRYIKKNVLHEIRDKALKFRIGSLV
uniref:Uncharacterized protein n=1 Tax=Nosema pernyi TaxID=1112939 RepID=X5EP96_9MICR|nr:hypothetical protein NP_03H05 [Nosema pernyi]